MVSREDSQSASAEQRLIGLGISLPFGSAYRSRLREIFAISQKWQMALQNCCKTFSEKKKSVPHGVRSRQSSARHSG
jgi:hypothetical protein